MATRLAAVQEARYKKLSELKKLGINPYPSHGERTHTAREASELKSGEATVVGRIWAIRGHGGATFIDLRDSSGKIQLYFQEDKLGKEEYAKLELLDMGDFLEAFGEVFKTEKGEPTVKVSKWRLLTKSLRPLPSTWHGLKDVEERYRQRYVDLLLNPKAKEVLETRSRIIATIRKFLIEEKGFIEVETPILQPIYGGGRAKPFKTHHNSLDTDLYLRISTELYLKRLIGSGFEKVFEIGRVFRNEGMDRSHNPEFTMLETMEAYANYMSGMNLVEEMFEFVTKMVFGSTKISYQGKSLDFKRPWERVRLEDLFKKHISFDINEVDTLEKASKLAKELGVKIEDYMTDGEILLEIFEKKCTDQLIQPTFIYDYPKDFYPLAKRRTDNPKIAESFDIYVAGMEMGTNWSEQNDPEILRKAWEEEADKEKKGNKEAQQKDEDFLEMLEYGMPPTGGIGPGIDRWMMVLTDSSNIKEVIAFPTLRPEKKK